MPRHARQPTAFPRFWWLVGVHGRAAGPSSIITYTCARNTRDHGTCGVEISPHTLYVDCVHETDYTGATPAAQQWGSRSRCLLLPYAATCFLRPIPLKTMASQRRVASGLSSRGFPARHVCFTSRKVRYPSVTPSDGCDVRLEASGSELGVRLGRLDYTYKPWRRLSTQIPPRALVWVCRRREVIPPLSCLCPK